MERTNEKVKIFLNNGFKYEGVILSDEDGFIVLRDQYNKKLKISKAAITIIEPMGGY